MSRTLLLEIGCEELPTSFIQTGIEQLEQFAPEELSRARICHGAVRALGTPRRLALLVNQVAEEVEARTEVLIGPAESVARTPDGQWTRAAEGFARRNDVPLSALSIVETPKGRYVQVQKVHPGGRTTERLPEVLETLVRRIAFPKSMRWADIDVPFGRPVQWLVGLFGSEVVPFTFVRLTAGRVTRGHRFLSPGPVEIQTADDYVRVLRSVHVLVDPEERREVLRTSLERAASAEGGRVVHNAALENEVLGLIEEPFAVVGRFDPSFLTLPDELIETVMGHHQRYFAVRDAEGKLLPLFITAANTAVDAEKVRKGNERVMRARLRDAQFFVEQDTAVPLEARVPRLDGVVYHQKLGTYGDKVVRLEQLCEKLAPLFGVNDLGKARRAARLAKADLLTLTVGEFPELQGVMGGYYARRDGESPDVAAAIAEHYMPRGAEDAVPPSRLGAMVSVADRLDTLVGFFAIGQKPSGGGDPFGLRRAALGLLRILVQHKVPLSLRDGITLSQEVYGRQLSVGREVLVDLVEFILERLEGLLHGQGYPPDLVTAAMAARAEGSAVARSEGPTTEEEPLAIVQRVEALTEFARSHSTAFAAVIRVHERCYNLGQKAPDDCEPDVSRLVVPEERGLVHAYHRLGEILPPLLRERKYLDALHRTAEILPQPVDAFFDRVFVMTEEVPLREARLRLLHCIANLVGRIAGFHKLSAAAYEGTTTAKA